MQALPRSASVRGLLNLVSPWGSSRGPFICASCLSRQQQQRRVFSSSPSFGTPPPPPPPAAGHARLTSRRLLSISGTDAPHFLQGLTTTSIEGEAIRNGSARPQQPQKHWYYCGFLNALGRVLHDVFIYPVPPSSLGSSNNNKEEPHFLIEVDAAQATALLKHLKRYKLRSKIALRAVDEDEMSVWQVWDDDVDANGITTSTTPTLQIGNNNGSSTIVVPDLRAPGMGYRVLTRGTDLVDVAGTLQGLQQGRETENRRADESAYRIRRYLLGVAEGGAEIVPAHALPQESNMDVMGGIDFRKGCYVGQELTIRTRHRGVVRKRILPCVLYPEGAAAPESLVYDPSAFSFSSLSTSAEDQERQNHQFTIGRLGKKGRSTGTFLSGVGNIGLALCRVQLMTDLVVPNDTASSFEFDPAAEFVLQQLAKDKGDDANIEAGQQQEDGSSGVGAGVVKVKAFVPDWLRQRLAEDAVKQQQQH